MTLSAKLVLFAALVVAIVVAQDAIPKMDFDVLLNNDEYVKTQLQCINNKNPAVCDRIAKRLRTVLLPDVAKTGACTICNEQEKILLGKAAWVIKQRYPDQWDLLLNEYKVPAEIRPKVLAAEMAANKPKP